MKIQIRVFLTAALFVAMTACRANADTTPPGTNSAALDTNANPSSTMTALFGDPVIARGKGVEVKQSALDEVVLGIKSAAAAHNENIPPQQLLGIESQMLNRLIQIQLLLQKATPADKATGQAKAEEQLTNLLARAGSQEAFDRQLKAVGMSPEELRTKITQEATATATLTRELGVKVSEADATNYYAAHLADFELPETAHVRHILLLTIDPMTHKPLTSDQIEAKRKQIEDILKRVKAGEDFATLAEKYSEDPGSKDKGGELSEFPRGAQGMPPELEAAAFSLNTNQVSDVITMDVGFDIVKLIGKNPARKLAFNDKLPRSEITVADYIKNLLEQKKTQKLAPAYLAGLTKAADVEILDPDLKAAAAAAATNAPPEMP